MPEPGVHTDQMVLHETVVDEGAVRDVKRVPGHQENLKTQGEKRVSSCAGILFQALAIDQVTSDNAESHLLSRPGV